MKQLMITKGERRFLILWLATWSFAFFVNLTDINGKIFRNTTPQYIFTENSEHRTQDFYPFTTFIEAHCTCFNGIFNSFNLVEWVVYCLIGIGIVFIPKIW